MIRLGSAPNGWIDLLPGVRARFDPISRPMVRAARRAAAAALDASGAAVANGLETDDAHDHDRVAAEVAAGDRRAEAGDAFTAELIRRGLREWDGVGDADGAPLEITPAALEQFIAEPLLFEAVDAHWVMPWALQATEKNGSSPSPAGTSVAATGAKTIADSAVTQAKVGRAKRPDRGAKRAPTASTRRRPKLAKGSGK